MKTIKFLFVCALALPMVSGCVAEQDVAVLEHRVAALERQNTEQTAKNRELEIISGRLVERFEGVSQNFETSGKSFRENYADLQAEIDAMKENIVRLSGQIEEVNHNLSLYGETAFSEEKQNLKRLDVMVSKNYQRLMRLENYMGFEPAAAGAEGIQPAPGAAVLPPTEGQLYASAKAYLDQGDHENARAQFELFLKQYPESENADNATFWIADTYYRDKWYEKAILEYQKVIEKYANGNKVPAALLKQGFSFANLGEKANARLILKELVKKYPNSNEAKIATDKLKVL